MLPCTSSSGAAARAAPTCAASRAAPMRPASRAAPARAALLGVALAATLAVPAPAGACSVCGCGDPLVPVGEVAGPRGALAFSADWQYLTQKAGSEEPGMVDLLTQNSLVLTGAWTPLDRLNVVVQLPFVWKRMQMDMDGAVTTTSNLAGLGDMQVGLRWFVLDEVSVASRTRQALSLDAGTSIPTGSDSAAVDGVRVDEHGQLGTGAWGPYLGLFYRLQGDVWSGYAGLWGVYRTENAYGYRYGTALRWTVAAQLQPAEWFAAGLGVDGRWADADVDLGAAVPSTGGLVLAAAPAAYFRLFEGGWVYAKAQVPFATALQGIQTIGTVVTAGLRVELP
jgi:hypothetical protein